MVRKRMENMDNAMHPHMDTHEGDSGLCTILYPMHMEIMGMVRQFKMPIHV